MANKEYSIKRFNQLTQEISLLQNIEIPEIEICLNKAYMELENVSKHKRSEKVRERYNQRIRFYEEHKKYLENELQEYQYELNQYIC